MSDPVRLDIASGIATITLARPEKLNALDDVMVGLLGRFAHRVVLVGRKRGVQDPPRGERYEEQRHARPPQHRDALDPPVRIAQRAADSVAPGAPAVMMNSARRF